MKKIFLFLGMLAVLVLSACAAPANPNAAPAQGAAAPAPAQQVQQPGQPPRTISVNGSGQVTLAPDVAYVYVGVQSQAANVSDALSENNKKAQSVGSALQEMGIDVKDIQTSSFNIYPQQQFGPQNEVTSTTYVVNNTVYVTVRDLQKLGQLLDVVVRSGANSINGITFDVLDKGKAISQARQLAVESARSQADEMAQAAGVTLGELWNMTVYSTTPPTPVFEGKGAAAMDASQVPVSAGQMVIRVEVNASYLIR